MDAAISDNVRDFVALFRTLPDAKASFATKWVNPDLLGYDPAGRTRVRMSLIPVSRERHSSSKAYPNSGGGKAWSVNG